MKLGSWSIYHATKTPFRFGDYWYPFPATAEVRAKSYLRINWGKAIVTSPPKDTINTGDSSWNFLFGHGFEEFDIAQGAIAICKTKNNKEVSNANIFADWWQWGETGFKRESIAVNNKPTSLWNSNSTLPKVPKDESLIVIADKLGFPHSLASFDTDKTPTPLSHNTLGMTVTQERKTCSWNTKDVELTGEGYLFSGGSKFKIVTKNTRGPAFFESMFFILRTDDKVFTYTICKDVLLNSGGGTWWQTGFFPTTNLQTVLPVGNAAKDLTWAKFRLQAVVVSAQSFSISNHLVFQAGK